jgi:hypothetical protein
MDVDRFSQFGSKKQQEALSTASIAGLVLVMSSY